MQQTANRVFVGNVGNGPAEITDVPGPADRSRSSVSRLRRTIPPGHCVMSKVLTLEPPDYDRP